jgi:peptidoglycan lytic transglycosylase
VTDLRFWLLSGIGTVMAVLTMALISRAGSAHNATASWYGPGLYGNTLACGGRMEPGSFHVAHRYLRCGTRLVVCFRGRCRRTWVGDRGPYVGGRTFDLASGLARSLRFSGVQRVTWWVR